MLNKLARGFFFSNFFYGICTVGLSIEANLQQNIGLNSAAYYLLIFFLTVIYYIYAYMGESAPNKHNERGVWYASHRSLVKAIIVTSIIAIALTLAYLLWQNFHRLLFIKPLQYLLPFATAILAFLYYAPSDYKALNVRSAGWLKSFVIGWVWALFVTYIPAIWHQVETGIPYYFSKTGYWLLLKNFMFISLLAILFDIKDYASDYNNELKTFVVRIGLRNTIFTVVIPLSVIGLIAFLIFAFANHFPPVRIAINLIPFILLIIVSYSMYQRKPILYYLAIIDGLMVVKAICGISAYLLTK